MAGRTDEGSRRIRADRGVRRAEGGPSQSAARSDVRREGTRFRPMFSRLQRLVRAHPVLAFYALGFPLSWRGYLVALVHPGGELGLDPYGPLVAAIVVTAI